MFVVVTQRLLKDNQTKLMPEKLVSDVSACKNGIGIGNSSNGSNLWLFGCTISLITIEKAARVTVYLDACLQQKATELLIVAQYAADVLAL